MFVRKSKIQLYALYDNGQYRMLDINYAMNSCQRQTISTYVRATMYAANGIRCVPGGLIRVQLDMIVNMPTLYSHMGIHQEASGPVYNLLCWTP